MSGENGTTEGVKLGMAPTDTSLTVLSVSCETSEVSKVKGTDTSDVLASGGELKVTDGMSLATAGGDKVTPDKHHDPTKVTVGLAAYIGETGVGNAIKSVN